MGENAAIFSPETINCVSETLSQILPSCVVTDVFGWDWVGRVRVPLRHKFHWVLTLSPPTAKNCHVLDIQNGYWFSSSIPYFAVDSAEDVVLAFLSAWLSLAWVPRSGSGPSKWRDVSPKSWKQRIKQMLYKYGNQKHTPSEDRYPPSINFVELVDWDFLTHKERAWETP